MVHSATFKLISLNLKFSFVTSLFQFLSLNIGIKMIFISADFSLWRLPPAGKQYNSDWINLTCFEQRSRRKMENSQLVLKNFLAFLCSLEITPTWQSVPHMSDSSSAPLISALQVFKRQQQEMQDALQLHSYECLSGIKWNIHMGHCNSSPRQVHKLITQFCSAEEYSRALMGTKRHRMSLWGDLLAAGKVGGSRGRVPGAARAWVLLHSAAGKSHI